MHQSMYENVKQIFNSTKMNKICKMKNDTQINFLSERPRIKDAETTPGPFIHLMFHKGSKNKLY